MLIDSVATLTDVLEAEVKQEKINFVKDESEAIHVSAMEGEATANEQVIDAMRDLAKALHILWGFSEKRFLLERYLTSLNNEVNNPMGIAMQAQDKINLGFEYIPPVEKRLGEAYLKHLIDKLYTFSPDDLTVEQFKLK